jgi:hypothetical protein
VLVSSTKKNANWLNVAGLSWCDCHFINMGYVTFSHWKMVLEYSMPATSPGQCQAIDLEEGALIWKL